MSWVKNSERKTFNPIEQALHLKAMKERFGFTHDDLELKGYGTKATRAALHFAFHTLNLHRVELEVFDFNRRAMRAYEKAGFRLEGTRREAIFQDGAYHHEHVMAILRQEFEALNPG
jgi:RimJ/RimL family protein N-acetyltransferase